MRLKTERDIEREKLKARIRKRFHKACADYGLIEEGDHILIGLSGGKDSLMLAELLGERARIYVPRFKVTAVHVRMREIAYESDTQYLEAFCREHGVELVVKEGMIKGGAEESRFSGGSEPAGSGIAGDSEEREFAGDSGESEFAGGNAESGIAGRNAGSGIAGRNAEGDFAESGIAGNSGERELAGRKEKNHCFLCSWYRRKMLFDLAQELKCNKIALGHHKDDIVETLLMNMVSQGAFATMPPKLKMDKMPLEIVRPLCLNEEADIARYAELAGYEKQKKVCPFEKESSRSDMKEIVARFKQMNPNALDSFWGAMMNIKREYLPKGN